MAINNRGLGRGIQALFNEEGPENATSTDSPLMVVPIKAIKPNPSQPRETFTKDRLAELALSIAAHGILQPLLVRPGTEQGTWELIAGERRLRAAQQAGLHEVPVICRPLDNREALIVTLLENLQREDLNPIEEAKGFAALKEAMNGTIDELASTLGQARGTVSNSLRLLKLPEKIQADVVEGRISPTHAKAICGLPTEETMLQLREQILQNGLNTKETENSVAYWNEHERFPWEDENAGKLTRKERQHKDPAIVRLANDIGALLKCRTKISGNAARGRISLAYDSNAQLYDILEKLGMRLDS